MAEQHAGSMTSNRYSALITWAVAIVGLVAVLPLLWLTYQDSLGLLEGIVAIFLAGTIGIVALILALLVYPSDRLSVP